MRAPQAPLPIEGMRRSEESKIFRRSRENAAGLLTKVLHELDGWKYIMEKRDVKFFKKKSKDGKGYSINAITKMQASLDEVMEALYCSDTDSYRTLMSQLYDDKFSDGSVMANFKPRTDSSGAFREKCGLKWLSFKPFNTLGKARDFSIVDYCAVRASSKVGQGQQDRIGIQLFYSVERSECPDNSSFKIERSTLAPSGYVVYPTTKEGVVEVIFCWSVEDANEIRIPGTTGWRRRQHLRSEPP